MAYYRVTGEIYDEVEEYVEAKSKKEAIKKAEQQCYEYFENVDVERITKEEYEEYK